MKRLISLIPLLFWANAAHTENFTTGHLRRLERISNPTLSDLEHEFPGCPANSICNEQVGKKMTLWRKKIKNLEGQSSQAIHVAVQDILNTQGIPIRFLVKKEDISKVQPSSILWTTRCHQHRNKTGPLIFKAMAFTKKLANNPAAIYPKVTIKTGKNKEVYPIPFDETPIMIKDNALIVGQDTDNIFYHIAINKDGKLSVKYIPNKQLQIAALKIENTQCGESSVNDGPIFKINLCKKVWNANTNELVDIEIQWSCP